MTQTHASNVRGLLSITGAKLYFIVAGYVVQLALPRLLKTPEMFGLYATAMNLISILNNVLIVATLQSVSKFVSEDDAHGPAALRKGLYIQLLIGVVLSAVFFFSSQVLADKVLLDHALAPLLKVCAGVLFCYALYAALVGYLNGKQRFGVQAQLDMTFSTLRTAGILGGAVLGFGALGAMSGFALAALGILIVALWRVGIGKPGTAPQTQRWVAFLLPLWIYQLAVSGMMQIDLAVLKRVAAELALAQGELAQTAAETASRSAGYYRAAQTFAFIPYQLILSVTFVVFPMISKARSTQDHEALKRTIRGALRFSLLFALCVAAPIAGAADGIMRVAYPADYLVGASALRILIFAQVAFSLFVVSSTVLSSAGRPMVAAAFSVLTVLAIVVGIYTGIHGISPAPDLGTIRGHADVLARTSMAVACAMVLALIGVGATMQIMFGAWLSLKTCLRALMAGTAGFGVAFVMPHPSALLSLVALFLGALAYALVLWVTGELTWTEFQPLLKRKGHSKS